MSQKLQKLKINKKQEKVANWHQLCEILAIFGAVKNKDELILKWATPDIDQFKFLTNLIRKITNCRISGRYNEYQRHWSIFI